jgi:endonuclease/exonuclease/phosphatase family metal-dependent hydrolase
MKVRWKKTVVRIIASLCLFAATPVLVQRKHILNYGDPQGPSQQASYADSAQALGAALRVVTWNLHFGQNLDRIIATLETSGKLQGADLLLLQEINADGVDKIARSLHYNYAYVPTVYSRQRGKEFGIAILSRWPLKESQRIPLPNWFPGWIENRYAIRAVASVGGREVAVYTVHMDLLWMEPQSQFLAEEMGEEPGPSILGGDFNTWRPSSVFSLENDMTGIGMDRLTNATGYTFQFSNFHSTLDHIFSAAGLHHTSGVYLDTNASDHYPLWAEISIDAQK